MDTERILADVVEVIEGDPHGASALTLYALVSTLEHPGAGCLFKLDKFRDLDADGRRLACALIELMVAGEVGSAAWRRAKTRMDDCVRRG